MKIETLEIILTRNTESYKKRSGYPPSDFWTKISASHEILLYLEPGLEPLDKDSKERTRFEAEKNFIINICSGLEVFFKDLVKILCDNGKVRTDLNELLADKISLHEAYSLFKIKNPTIGDLISLNISFQSLVTIAGTFDKLLKIDFLKTIEDYHFTSITDGGFLKKGEVTSLMKVNPEWRKIVSELFNKRHEYVHEYNPEEEITPLDTFNILHTLACLTSAIDQYFNLQSFLSSKK